jgi:hypothetical protein
MLLSVNELVFFSLDYFVSIHYLYILYVFSYLYLFIFSPPPHAPFFVELFLQSVCNYSKKHCFRCTSFFENVNKISIKL